MERDKLMLKGYLEGYQDGFRDGASGKVRDDTFLGLPVRMMPLSARARNCLTAAGCDTVAEVVDLEESKIARMRNLGVKTGKEIALWLAENGIFESAWGKLYLI